ncbi:MAG: bifunctional phosphoribosylaminoimidazolecarboxamide formyltransferase/IMP cyclohydrolase [Phycisphaeraceae bacterium]|nr:bifunctional phosphoribosylaminoimidazolecarboxamide formyltransferase/IMP cyclohydrolase [Phycisphaeraceae bacterium]
MTDLVRVRTALISLSDKTGLLELARGLAAHGVQIISTGGTSKVLHDAGAPVTSVEDLTRFPEILDGRVKTLHPAVHGGILARRDLASHCDALQTHHIRGIDLVCINLYPFESTISQPGITLDQAIEQIDIGGPAMIRSAAKNADWVCVVTDPAQYAELLTELHAHAGCTTREFRRRLARAAFRRTAFYDATISMWLSEHDPANMGRDTPISGDATQAAHLPTQMVLPLERVSLLRYGENPHQAAAAYAPPVRGGTSVLTAHQMHGKPLSYNNLADASAAVEAIRALRAVDASAAGACIVKHTNPCGLALARDLPQAADAALRGDPIASYGGIIALSEPVDVLTAECLTREGMYLEVVIAPSFAPESLELLQSRWKLVRLLEIGPITPQEPGSLEIRTIPGGALIQERDTSPPRPSTWQHAAGPVPTKAQLHTAAVMEVVVRSLTSNAVVIGGDATPSTDALTPDGASRASEPPAAMLFGAGAGQMDRLAACRIAIEKAGARAKGGVAVSDAFFPFADGPKLLIEAGVRVIVHPGGSKRDQDTIDACRDAGVTCLLTGVRRFRH